MAARRFLYIETDGQVYLVRDPQGRLAFPSEDVSLPFDVEARHEARIGDDVVVFARPRLEEHPFEWVYKDTIPGRTDVDPLVRQAVNASLTRCVVGVAVVREDGRVLMVKSNRGFTKGMWNIPGGFIEYGEHPEAAAVREIREEVGLDVSLGDLLGVWMERFESPYFMYGFMYDATTESVDVRLEPTEIADSRWMAPAEAYEATENPFARAAFAKRFGLPQSESDG